MKFLKTKEQKKFLCGVLDNVNELSYGDREFIQNFLRPQYEFYYHEVTAERLNQIIRDYNICNPVSF